MNVKFLLPVSQTSVKSCSLETKLIGEILIEATVISREVTELKSAKIGELDLLPFLENLPGSEDLIDFFIDACLSHAEYKLEEEDANND